MWTCCLSCSIALYLITNSFILAHFSWSGSHLAGRWVWWWLPVHLKMRSAWMPIVLSRWKRKPAFKCGMRGAECEGTISSCYFSSIWMEGKRRQLRVIKLNAATVPLIRFPRATVRMFSDDWGIDYSGARITHLWQMWYEREFISLFWFFVVVFFSRMRPMPFQSRQITEQGERRRDQVEFTRVSRPSAKWLLLRRVTVCVGGSGRVLAMSTRAPGWCP